MSVKSNETSYSFAIPVSPNNPGDEANNVNTIFRVCSGFYVGTPGNLKIRMASSNTSNNWAIGTKSNVTFMNVPAGTTLKIKADMVLPTGLSGGNAASLLALF